LQLGIGFVKIIKQIFSWVMLLSLFITPSIKNFNGLFDLYWFYPIYLILIVIGIFTLKKTLVKGNKFLLFWLIIFLISTTANLIHPYPIENLLKQSFGFLFVGLAWFVFFKLKWLTIHETFNAYLKIAIIAAFLTIPEQILHYNGIHLTPMKGAWLGMFRCYSICEEPFYLALLIAPALIHLLKNLEQSKDYIILTILTIGLFFTFSGAAWLGIILYFIVKLFKQENYKQIIVSMALIIGILSILFAYKGTQTRIKQSYELFAYFPQIPNIQFLESQNTSSRSIYLNSVVAWQQFKLNPLIGGGIGSHKSAYEKIIIKKMPENAIAHYNVNDGGSGLIRWISEFGLLGIFLILFLLKSLVLSKKNNIKEASLSYWLIHLIHAGNFFSHGTFFWIFITKNRWFETDSNNKEGKP